MIGDEAVNKFNRFMDNVFQTAIVIFSILLLLFVLAAWLTNEPLNKPLCDAECQMHRRIEAYQTQVAVCLQAEIERDVCEKLAGE